MQLHDTITSEAETLELLSLTVNVDMFGTTRYLNADGETCRLFGPAVITKDGAWDWWWCDLPHRAGGPADSFGRYWLFGWCMSKEEYDLECINKTMPQWKEYDEYIRSRDF